ncbi:hypothetical protein niasHS_000314 [Heterodera schachtii]|uniref:Uncharacterized protein n=1 Tax=Heterodera schachtii TaxID=97005 RepID=A0ABD2KIA4_HETSC
MNKQRLPSELICEIIATIPLMYLFGGISKKPGSTRPPSGIAVINNRFEIFRATGHSRFIKVLNLARNFERICAMRKLPCGELFIQFGFLQFGFKDELEDAKYFADFLMYLCFGRSGPTATTRVVTYSAPNKIGELFTIILDYVLQSVNPFTMKKRTAGGYLSRQHFPSVLQTSTTKMAERGIGRLVREDGMEMYRLKNPHHKRDVGYLIIIERSQHPGSYYFNFSIE